MLSNQQKRQFVDEGYIVVPGAVPGVMVEAARRAVNHSIGHVGVGGEDLAKHRAYEAYFKEHGHAVLAEGRPPIELPVEPVMVTARAGDLVVAHHALMHGACPNESADVRLAAISRLKHVDVEQLGTDAYLDIWKEWSGVQEVLESEPV